MYPENYLVKCQYNSTKNGIPINPSSYYDPYISQILKCKQILTILSITTKIISKIYRSKTLLLFRLWKKK
jgi:hypothetical protein